MTSRSTSSRRIRSTSPSRGPASSPGCRCITPRRGAAGEVFVRLARNLGVTARYDQMEDTDGLLTDTPQILRSVTVGPMWYFSSAREGIFSNVEHTRFHLPQIALRAAVRADWSSQPFFADAGGALQGSNTTGVLELVYVF